MGSLSSSSSSSSSWLSFLLCLYYCRCWCGCSWCWYLCDGDGGKGEEEGCWWFLLRPESVPALVGASLLCFHSSLTLPYLNWPLVLKHLLTVKGGVSSRSSVQKEYTMGPSSFWLQVKPSKFRSSIRVIFLTWNWFFSRGNHWERYINNYFPQPKQYMVRWSLQCYWSIILSRLSYQYENLTGIIVQINTYKYLFVIQ